MLATKEVRGGIANACGLIVARGRARDLSSPKESMTRTGSCCHTVEMGNPGLTSIPFTRVSSEPSSALLAVPWLSNAISYAGRRKAASKIGSS